MALAYRNLALRSLITATAPLQQLPGQITASVLVPPSSSADDGRVPGSSSNNNSYSSPWHLPRGQSFAHSGLAVQQQVQQAQQHEVVHEVDAVTIRVVTGNLRGAGTGSPAWIQLIGTDGTSPKILLADSSGEQAVFERGSVKNFTASVPKSIGQLRRVFVEKAKGGLTEQGEGWYLQQVEVESASGDHFVFHCNSWLGESDCGGYVGPLERNLLPSAHTTVGLQLEDPEPVSVTASAMAIPHPDKITKTKVKEKGVNRVGAGYGGEDAYFFCQSGGLFGMGVADGVYAWRNQGIDSGELSRVLMEKSKQTIEGGMEDSFQVFQAAAKHVAEEGILGSATVCLLTINTDNGMLHAANLGDAGFLVFGESLEHQERHFGHGTPVKKHMEVKYRTNQLEHEFGRPYQLGHHEHSSRVEDSDLACFHVVPGDVIVMGTDGLLDNVSEKEMMVELSHLKTKGASAGEMVQRLVKMAFEASIDKKRSTPYSKGASEFFDMVYSGGKKDDITVMVVLVGPHQPQKG